MRIELIKIYKSVHTWTGIVAGLMLYIAFVGGALTMFKMPLNQWVLQAETTLPAIDRHAYDDLIQQVLRAHPEAANKFSVHLPSSYPQHAPITWAIETDTHAVTQWQASLDNAGNVLTANHTASAIGDFVDDLHRTAGIPGTWGHAAIGTYFLGVVAGVYFVALVSGLVIFLPTWFSDLLAFRKGKNRKRYWLDLHNILGITSLPFHIIIAFTSFVFAFHDPIYDTLQAVVYKDAPMFDRAASTGLKPVSELAGIDQLEREIQVLEPDFEMAEMTYIRINSPAPQVMVGGVVAGQITRGAEFSYVIGNPFTAVMTNSSMLPSHLNQYTQFFVSFFSLHVGSYGGQTVRWLYFCLGISGALLFLTGNILWIESRRKRQKKRADIVSQTRSSMVMARLTVGVSLGTLLGITLAFICAKYLPQHRIDIVFWQQAAYYVGFLFALAWVFVQKPIVAAKQLLLLTCGLILIVPASSLWLRNSVSTGLWVNTVSVIIFVLLMLVYRWIKLRAVQIGRDSVWSG